MKRIACIIAAAAVLASTSNGQLLADNFNSENGGNSAQSYASFANWTATGQVSLFRNGSNGINCSGLCVAFDGLDFPSSITAKQTFSFVLGDVMRFSFDVSGNQRSAEVDNIFLRLMFGSAQQFTSYSSFFGFPGGSTSPGSFASTFTIARSGIAQTAPFANFWLEFTAATSGSVQYALGSNSVDGFGPVVDNVLVTRNAAVVPEPSAWTMILAGLCVLSSVARRRRNFYARG